MNTPDEPPEIQVTIKNHTRLNYAVALKRWPDETDRHWEKRLEKMAKLRHKIYALAQMTPDDQIYYHQPSYVHPE
jgi:preprotein translocase subunit SecA